MKSFSPYLSIFPQHQQFFWEKIQTFSQDGFVLYGGTAIALQLGHRTSVDYDFFSNEPLNKEGLYQKYPWLLKSQIIQDEANSLSLLVHKEETAPVRFSFYGGLSHGRYNDPLMPTGGNIQVAALEDLLATKCKTVLQRIEVKDYHDIAAMLAHGIPLDLGLSIANQIYSPSFQPSEALKALVYFEGGDLSLLSEQEKDVIKKQVAQTDKIYPVELKKSLLKKDL